MSEEKHKASEAKLVERLKSLYLRLPSPFSAVPPRSDVDVNQEIAEIRQRHIEAISGLRSKR